MAEFGTDIAGTTDLDPGFAFVSGPAALAQALVRRLSTPRGALQYAPGYGIDLRDMIEEAQTRATVAAWQLAIARECEKDERIARAAAQVTFTAATSSARVVLQLETADGPFRLTLAVTAVTVEILES